MTKLKPKVDDIVEIVSTKQKGKVIDLLEKDSRGKFALVLAVDSFAEGFYWEIGTMQPKNLRLVARGE